MVVKLPITVPPGTPFLSSFVWMLANRLVLLAVSSPPGPDAPSQNASLGPRPRLENGRSMRARQWDRCCHPSAIAMGIHRTRLHLGRVELAFSFGIILVKRGVNIFRMAKRAFAPF
jgi:hypothetical protein